MSEKPTINDAEEAALWTAVYAARVIANVHTMADAGFGVSECGAADDAIREFRARRVEGERPAPAPAVGDGCMVTPCKPKTVYARNGASDAS